MSDETQEATLPESNEQVDSLQKSVEALERKNHELIGKLKKAKSVPDDVDVQALIDYKNNAEQAKLESQGKYTEARTQLEDQFRERIAEKEKSVKDLEARVRELELISPAVSALADVVKDPDLVLNNFIPKDKIQIDNGVPIVNEGLDKLPITDWVKKNLQTEKHSYLLKQETPRGGGAPAGRTGSSEIPAGTKNPFAPESFNITEQMRLWRTDKSLYDKLQAAAKR
jgi:hypothetical protein